LESVVNKVPLNRLSLFPDTTSITDKGLGIGGWLLSALAAQYGTPLYLYDRLTLDACVARYRQALARYNPAPTAPALTGFCQRRGTPTAGISPPGGLANPCLKPVRFLCAAKGRPGFVL